MAKEILYLVFEQDTFMLLYKSFISDIPNRQCQHDAVVWCMTVFLPGQLCRLDHGHGIQGLISTATLCDNSCMLRAIATTLEDLRATYTGK